MTATVERDAAATWYGELGVAFRRASPAKRAGVVALAVMAGLNIAAGVVLGFTHGLRAQDLITVWNWCRSWLLYGHPLYSLPLADVDYPPNAIVVFSPIALLDARWLLPVWTASSLALTFALPLAIARATNPAATLQRTTIAVLCFFCWACVRNLLQFSLPSLTLAFLAVLLADTRPTRGGVALGAALAKPHVAGPLALGLLIAGRVRAVATAAAVVIGSVFVYSWRQGSRAWTVTLDYFHVLQRMYGGASGFVGRTGVRPWIAQLVGVRWVDSVWIAIVVVLGAIPCVLLFLDRRSICPARAAAVRALLCLWALLSVFQVKHNFILFLPAFILLVLTEHPPTRRERDAAAAILSVAMTLDLPIRLTPYLTSDLALGMVSNSDRVLAVSLYAYVISLWVRLGAKDGLASGVRAKGERRMVDQTGVEPVTS